MLIRVRFAILLLVVSSVLVLPERTKAQVDWALSEDLRKSAAMIGILLPQFEGFVAGIEGEGNRSGGNITFCSDACHLAGFQVVQLSRPQRADDHTS
jgi:hypothetical protein